MSESEFWRTTPAFLHARIKVKQGEEKAAAEYTRIIAYYAAHSGRIKPTPNIRRFWPLPWDEKPKIANVESDKLKAMSDAMDARRAARKAKANGTN